MSKIEVDWPYESCGESCPLANDVNEIINNEIKSFCGEDAKGEVYTEEKSNVECQPPDKSKRRIYYNLKLYRDGKRILFQAGGVGTVLCPRPPLTSKHKEIF